MRFPIGNHEKNVSNRIRGPIEAIKCEKIPVANRISFESPSTDELSSYIVASHAFIIGLKRLKLTFLKRTRDLLSENINKNASIRIRGALDAIKAKKGPSLMRFHSKAQGEGPKSPPGFPGPHGLTVGPRGLRVVPNERECDFLSEYKEI